MKKSKKDTVEIRKFMECFLGVEYERRPKTKKQRCAEEELMVKELLGIKISPKDRKRLKKATKFVLTHKGMMGYLIEKGKELPKRVSFEEAMHQDYDGERYIFVRDDADQIMPYKVPTPLLEKDLEDEILRDNDKHLILKNRIDTLTDMGREYKAKGDIENYLMVKSLLAEARSDLYKIYLENNDKNKEIVKLDYEEFEVTEKCNREKEHDKMYSYGRRKRV